MNWPLLITALGLIFAALLFTACVVWSYRDILFDKEDTAEENHNHKA